MKDYVILPQVKKLLNQYDEYKKVHADMARTASALARAKIKQLPTQDLKREHEALQATLQQTSDDMTFDSPIIWIQYKYEAYKNEAQPILTMQDLRVHCSKPDYICTKRYIFLNKALQEAGYASLDDVLHYPDEVLLESIVTVKSLQALTADASFMQQWRMYEYYKNDSVVAKWENYTSKQ